jgi:hypothetical protein
MKIMFECCGNETHAAGREAFNAHQIFSTVGGNSLVLTATASQPVIARQTTTARKRELR